MDVPQATQEILVAAYIFNDGHFWWIDHFKSGLRRRTFYLHNLLGGDIRAYSWRFRLLS